MLALVVFLPCLAIWLSFTVYSFLLRYTNTKRKQLAFEELGLSAEASRSTRLIGFFHPYCNAGGGGERVLWTAIAALQRTEPDVVSVVYSGDTDASKSEIIKKVSVRID
ncbi:hypothetical protein C0989_005799 [Termitomyces sp. Mn162]|nr:hypothetical protein C0989_005799 [Termitomyces sp. Mn162]